MQNLNFPGKYWSIRLDMISCESSAGFLEAGTKFENVFSVTWVKVFRNIPEFRILRLTFHRKTASKC